MVKLFEEEKNFTSVSGAVLWSVGPGYVLLVSGQLVDLYSRVH